MGGGGGGRWRRLIGGFGLLAAGALRLAALKLQAIKPAALPSIPYAWFLLPPLACDQRQPLPMSIPRGAAASTPEATTATTPVLPSPAWHNMEPFYIIPTEEFTPASQVDWSAFPTQVHKCCLQLALAPLAPCVKPSCVFPCFFCLSENVGWALLAV